MSLRPAAGARRLRRPRPRKKKLRSPASISLTIWPDIDALPASPGELLSTRLQILRELALSLEAGTAALAHNDAERIARGAARQAELCRQWSRLEEQIHLSGISRDGRAAPAIETEFAALTSRIRHLTRVHCSLLRHLQRSLAILTHFVERGAATYSPAANTLRVEPRPQAGD